jgi:hypothetical protein
MSRIRHCVECPNCLTRYLISFNPYSNGAYLRPVVNGCCDEYILYCSCRRGTGVSSWRANEVMPCKVSNAAFNRGYGTSAEIRPVPKSRESWSFDASQYLNDWKSQDRRKGTS